MTFIQYLSAVKDAVTIVAAFVGGYIAWQGLATWRRQLQGTANHELARRWLLSAYKLRDEVENVRRAGWHGSEAAVALAESSVSLDGLSERERQQAVARAVYAMRWKPLSAARSELKANSLEAQVHWGNSAREAFFEVPKVTQKLWAAIVIDMKFSEDGIVENHCDVMKRKRIMWCMGGNRSRPGRDERRRLGA